MPPPVDTNHRPALRRLIGFCPGYEPHLGINLMSRIYLFTASKMEANPVFQVAKLKQAGKEYVPGDPFRVTPNEVTLIISGMGPQNAKASATVAFSPWTDNASSSPHPAREKPDFVLVIGLCGGLTESVREDEIVAYATCRSERKNGPMLPCCETITRRLPELLSPQGIRCRLVDGTTSPQIATRKSDREALNRSGASVVDMESYEILTVAAKAGIPVAVLRVVSDSFERELPNFNTALNAQGDLDGRKALRIALGAPLRTFKLLAANKRALRQLTPALEVVLRADWPISSGIE